MEALTHIVDAAYRFTLRQPELAALIALLTPPAVVSAPFAYFSWTLFFIAWVTSFSAWCVLLAWRS